MNTVQMTGKKQANTGVEDESSQTESPLSLVQLQSQMQDLQRKLEQVCLCVCVHLCMYHACVHAYVCVHACMGACMWVCVCVCVCVCALIILDKKDISASFFKGAPVFIPLVIVDVNWSKFAKVCNSEECIQTAIYQTSSFCICPFLITTLT